ncbi:hypothetical protein A2926_04615 [Candidatus Giovannonibacteria bacterium RIFCSPLOWO2_01_FULL_44_40]|uniref:Metallophosphoesterase n=1 Tax=Candidatus Giovannonibacteria bacterium RIFCSPHIGHO2_01_FULL_45_23 TaxID=1798325 RepID=A0A1F5VHS6_9BACT|nr:MAG: hypothetical protein A2834_03060 [Candidatus Giovannonibacteria bacterium RIFCSPHIGHO2_01_FULL_45_23]OGF75612.1 MAG: hypothetical protein A3C77_00920 [Candidatus Giovannonibacteria bacterium RIFCSPHIGHO2_02_FULL_45_13]OGF80119.1 MAG: hypothetical protein A2926_04615 [Candidatus Giovannonibacteria bacterium RIFCSPLOWO2_01_FULL_44_40]
MKLLIFGDVFGKLGREGVKRMLPVWREKFSPDVVIANVENIAHGKGIGMKQIQELRDAGVDVFTGGNHSFEGKDFEKVLNDETLPILRPANMGEGTAGRGTLIYETKSGEKPLVINLIGQVFMKQQYDNPFRAIDKILEEYGDTTPYKILDWHAEATSEKTVMGWYLDGKVSAVFGTHSHAPTADAKILPKGTAYISDVGMTGPYNSVIGAEIEPAIQRFKTGVKSPIQPAEAGPIEVNAVFVEIDPDGHAVDIRHLREILPEDNI